MAIKILLADPSVEWLKEAKAYFTEKMYEVEVVEDGRKAQLGLYASYIEKTKEGTTKDKIFAVILSLDIQNHSGMQVLKYVKANCAGLRIIVTTRNKNGFLAYVPSKHYFDKHGITDYFEDPFTLPQLQNALEGHQDLGTLLSKGPTREGVSDEEIVTVEDQKFSSIKIDEFVSTKAVQFDVYVRLESGRYVKILHSGDAFSSERIDRYKNEKNVTHLFFLAEDRRRYIRFQNFFADKILANEKVKVETKLQVIKNAGEKLVEEFYCEGIKPLAMDQGKALCNNIYDVVNGNQSLAALLREYKDFDPSSFSHSYLVCLFSCMLVKQFEWESKVVNETVGMASLLHDIGKLKLDKSLQGLRPNEMNPEQLVQYRMHPEMGGEILSGNNLISPLVRQVVVQHHEAADGTGFPSGLKRQKILTFARMVYMVDEFAHIMAEKELSPTKSLKFMLQQSNSVQRFGSLILENFIKIFVDPSKAIK